MTLRWVEGAGTHENKVQSKNTLFVGLTVFRQMLVRKNKNDLYSTKSTWLLSCSIDCFDTATCSAKGQLVIVPSKW